MKIGVVSLGCDKNRVDTEKMLARLVEHGHTVVSSEIESDIIIVNTCAFIESAKIESIDEILSALSYKADGKGVIVTGCMSERYPAELKDEFEEVDAFLGVASYDNIVDVVEKVANKISGRKNSGINQICITEKSDKFCSDRVLTTPYHYAYLKIADGCNNHCTYCAIPKIRGEYRSESIEDLMCEAQKLSDNGVKELMIVAQDVTRYGFDFDGRSHLIELLDQIQTLDFEWIRLLYLEPEMLSDELIDYIASSKKIVNYVDVPFQHISSSVLRRMGRHTDKQYTTSLVTKLKAKGIQIRTSFICGFPGETDADFEELVQFAKEFEIESAGVFGYSREENTPADLMPDHLDPEIIRMRADTLARIETDIILNNNKSYLSKTLRVIYDEIDYDKQLLVGRAFFQNPDIDTRVLFKTKDGTVANIGQFYDVVVEGFDGVDLVGSAL